MSYVKISDPAIIDLAGVQQIINVVNQHSDYLNALINRFGNVVIPDWEGDETKGVYDPATCALAFGKATVTPTSQNDEQTPGGKTFYNVNVTFDNVTFSQKPFVYLTLDNSDGTYNTQLDFILSAYNVSTNQFTLRAMRAGVFSSGGQPKYTIDNNIKVNWMAIGPR